MMIGMSVAAFTALHVVISIVAIVAGVVALVAMLKGRAPTGWTALFLVTTVLTSATGFLFPATGFTPAQGVGISLVLLAVALFALYAQHISGPWRWVYVLTAVPALFLNCFVLVAQSFQKLPFLRPLAPSGSELAFQLAQLVLLAIFVVAAVFAVRNFHSARRSTVALTASTP